LKVTNLKDYVPGQEAAIAGSFRAACETKGPRTIEFGVAGIIELKTTLRISEPFVTIAGQTAPGDGVCLKNYACVVADTHDVIIRYLRCRPGDEKKVALDSLSIGTSQNVILDHCSASWGNDEVLSVTGEGTTNITVQWCMISESLNESHHEKGRHGYGSLLRIDGDMTFHHNLYAHHVSRNPRPGTYGKEPGLLLDFRNNLIYDWGSRAGYSAKDPVRMNYVGNYLKPGPSTRDPQFAFSCGGETTALFVADNFLVGGGEKNRDNWLMIRPGQGKRMEKPFAVAPVKTDRAEEAYERILKEAGASLPVRDAVDRRIVEEIRTGRGRIIDSQKDVGGWPAYRSAR
jgi:pectate lyase